MDENEQNQTPIQSDAAPKSSSSNDLPQVKNSRWDWLPMLSLIMVITFPVPNILFLFTVGYLLKSSSTPVLLTIAYIIFAIVLGVISLVNSHKHSKSGLIKAISILAIFLGVLVLMFLVGFLLPFSTDTSSFD